MGVGVGIVIVFDRMEWVVGLLGHRVVCLFLLYGFMMFYDTIVFGICGLRWVGVSGIGGGQCIGIRR